MKISSLPHEIKATGLPLEQLAKNRKLSEGEKIADVSRQFETLLLRQILQNARKPVVHSKFNSDSVTNSVYDDMVTAQLAENVGRSGALGLFESLQLARQLTGKSKLKPESGPK